MKNVFLSAVLFLILTACAGTGEDAVAADNDFYDEPSGAPATDEYSESSDAAETSEEAGTSEEADASEEAVTSEEADASGTADTVIEPALWREFMESRMSGSVREHMRVEYGGRFYDLLVTDFERVRGVSGTAPWPGELETRVFVSEKRDGGYFFLNMINVSRRMGNTSGGLVIADVNFDGRGDVLVRQGYFGRHHHVTYDAFFYNNGVYRPLQRTFFSSIQNPVIDAENERIISTWRNFRGSHGGAFYAYTNGGFQVTDTFTRSPYTWGEEPNAPVILWRYHLSRFRDGEWTGETFFTGDPGADEIFAMFGYAARGPSPTLPPPLTLEQIQNTLMQEASRASLTGLMEFTVIAAERVPRERDYSYWETGQYYVILINAARYRVTLRSAQPLEDYLNMLERSPWLEGRITRDGDYTIETVYHYILGINGKLELIIYGC